ncbi:MAG: cupin [Parasphingopyxis sp.]
MARPDIFTHPLHLGLGATAVSQPEFSGMPWYEDYAKRTASDGAEGRLVTAYHFSEDWDVWEMHPKGDEAVICLAGAITLHQKMTDGTEMSVTLEPGEYAVNPPGCWHTADIADEATALFITAGQGTRHRPRN